MYFQVEIIYQQFSLPVAAEDCKYLSCFFSFLSSQKLLKKLLDDCDWLWLSGCCSSEGNRTFKMLNMTCKYIWRNKTIIIKTTGVPYFIYFEECIFSFLSLFFYGENVRKCHASCKPGCISQNILSKMVKQFYKVHILSYIHKYATSRNKEGWR